MGGLTLDTSLTSRDEVNARLRVVLDEVTEKWGVRVNRVELKDISPPKDIQLAAGVDEHGAHITVAFTLPAGSYATVLLRELMKNDSVQNEASPEQDAPSSENEEEVSPEISTDEHG